MQVSCFHPDETEEGGPLQMQVIYLSCQNMSSATSVVGQDCHAIVTYRLFLGVLAQRRGISTAASSGMKQQRGIRSHSVC